MEPVGHGTVTTPGSDIDKGHSQFPSSLLPDVPSDDEDNRGTSADFAHMDSD